MKERVFRLANQVKRVRGIHEMYALAKGFIQDRRANRTAAHYKPAAEELGDLPRTVNDVEAALRHRLRMRGVRPRAVRKGELHVFLAYSLTNWEAVLPVALSPFGRVTTFEWRSRGYDDRAKDWVERRDAMNLALLDAFEQANRLQPVDAFVGYLSGRNTARATLEAVGRSCAVIFNFCWDDRLNFPGTKVGGQYTSPAEIAAAVDLNLTNAPESIARYAVHGGIALFWPLAADPRIHRPYDRAFEFDVSFVGQKYGRRPPFIAALRRMGVPVVTFGEGWTNGPLSNEKMVELYSKTRINLGFSAVQYCRHLKVLHGRDFEVPMGGGLYLTEEHPDLHLVYVVGKEIMTYHDARDCAAKIRWLLEHPEEAARIRTAGRARALREHTWESRFDRIFRMSGLLD